MIHTSSPATSNMTTTSPTTSTTTTTTTATTTATATPGTAPPGPSIPPPFFLPGRPARALASFSSPSSFLPLPLLLLVFSYGGGAFAEGGATRGRATAVPS